jgi:hypothetical protein
LQKHIDGYLAQNEEKEQQPLRKPTATQATYPTGTAQRGLIS